MTTISTACLKKDNKKLMPALSSKKSLSRERTIDLAKAFGMLAVIWGHIEPSGWSSIFVYSFSIPLFFFLSGYCYNQKKYTDFYTLLKSRTKALLVPYAIFGVISYAFWVMYNALLNSLPENYLEVFLQLFLAQGGIEFNAALWFVPCLFLIEIVFYGLNKFNLSAKLLVGVFFAWLGYLVVQPNSFFDFKELPWSIEVIPSAMFFYIGGALLRAKCGFSYIPKLVREYKWVSLVCAILLSAFLLLSSQNNGRISMESGVLNNPFLFYFNGYLGISAVFLTSCLISVVASSKNICTRGLCFIGETSFYFMALHCPIKAVAYSVAKKAFSLLKITVPEMIIQLLVLIATVIASSIITVIIRIVKRQTKNKSKAAAKR